MLHCSRRDFIKASSASLSWFLIPDEVRKLFRDSTPVKLGLISDLHGEIIHDADWRLSVFLDEMAKEKPDARIQLGDFATPDLRFHDLIQSFNSPPGRHFHVLGNHDSDGGYSVDEVCKAYGMKSAYYRVEVAGIIMIVLNGNDLGSPSHRGGYPSYIGRDQQDWLIDQLKKANQPVLIVSHQPIAGIYTIDNAVEIQEILSRFASKVLLAVNGHAHVDQTLRVGGVNYLHLNSASYYWVGNNLAHLSLTPELHQEYPAIQNTCPYEEVLFSTLTIDPVMGRITLKGKKTRWIGPSPLELGYSILSPEQQQMHVQPQISDRVF